MYKRWYLGKVKKISKIVIYSNDTDNSAKSDFVNKNDDWLVINNALKWVVTFLDKQYIQYVKMWILKVLCEESAQKIK